MEDCRGDVPPALQELAQCRMQDAEEACHKLFKKYGLTVPIDVEFLNAGEEELEQLPFIPFSKWLKHLMDYDLLHRVTGVENKELPERLEEFWRRYKLLYPEHELFTLAENGQVTLKQCIPIFAHADEGRTYKNKALLVLSLHGCVGRGTRNYKKRLVRKPHIKRDPMGMNYAGATWGSHFIFTTLLRSAMVANPDSLDIVCSAFAQDMASLATTGVTSANGKQRLWAQLIGLKGDLPALAKLGKFVRNFGRAPKAQSGRVPFAGICWLCMAGCEQDPTRSLPYEDFRPNAAWIGTMFESRPWSGEDPPIMQGIPGLPEAPEVFFMTDIWHNFHNGLGKYWVASCFIMFATTAGLLPGNSIPAKLQFLSQDYVRFCRQAKITAFLKEFTRENLSFDSFRSYPQGIWSKAAVTTHAMLYIQHFCERDIRGKWEDAMLVAIASRLFTHPPPIRFNVLFACVFSCTWTNL